MNRATNRATLFCLLTAFGNAFQITLAAEFPSCAAIRQGESVQAALLRVKPSEAELLARLAHAEGISTGFPDDPRVYEAIAWGVMNRVRLAEASPRMRRRYGSGVAGVIFRKGQFNPAVSPRSRFSKAFLCPEHTDRWRFAVAAAGTALAGQNNPFIETPWEKTHGLSLVANFYYPNSVQARGPLAPWEGNRGLDFIGDVSVGGSVLPAERIRFYRLTSPPDDIR
jgi:hypothetical protein